MFLLSRICTIHAASIKEVCKMVNINLSANIWYTRWNVFLWDLLISQINIFFSMQLLAAWLTIFMINVERHFQNFEPQKEKQDINKMTFYFLKSCNLFQPYLEDIS